VPRQNVYNEGRLVENARFKEKIFVPLFLERIFFPPSRDFDPLPSWRQAFRERDIFFNYGIFFLLLLSLPAAFPAAIDKHIRLTCLISNPGRILLPTNRVNNEGAPEENASVGLIRLIFD
jgi:hypothetical protein